MLALGIRAPIDTPDCDMKHGLHNPVLASSILFEDLFSMASKAQERIHEAFLNRSTTLDLSVCGLETVPDEIQALTNLQELNLCHNKLAHIPAWIGSLSKLQRLLLNTNQLTTLPASMSGLNKLETLYLHFNPLRRVPAFLFDLPSIVNLSLAYNELEILDDMLGNLVTLKRLYLSGNSLVSVPNSLSRLSQLEVLLLKNNKIQELPSSIGALKYLAIIDLAGNPVGSVPQSVIAGGGAGIKRFLRGVEESRKNRYEAKVLLLGQGGVGKTSLVRHFTGRDFDADLNTTFGIEVSSITLSHDREIGKEIHLSLWDFAGQDIEHSTHRFFMKGQSIYVLAWNARHGYIQGRLNYWLDSIRYHAPKSPIILVATHTDQRPSDLNEAAIRENYPEVIAICSVDNRSGRGVKELLREIVENALNLPGMGQAWPASWLAVEKNLLLENQAHITMEQFLANCKVADIQDEQDVKILLNTLDNLGLLLHFDDDPILRYTIFLKPSWISKAISSVLVDGEVKAKRGVITISTLKRIWAEYPGKIFSVLVHLMNRFELSYIVKSEDDDAVLLPQLFPDLPTSAPNFRPSATLVFKLDSLPANLIGRFVVRTHRFLTDNYWKDGAVLAHDGQSGLVMLDTERKSLKLAVGGTNPTNFLCTLIDTMNEILKSYPGVNVKRMIPCTCQGGPAVACSHLFDLEYLVRLFEKNRPSAECQVSLVEVDVAKLLFGIHAPASKSVVQEAARMVNPKTAANRQTILLAQRSALQTIKSAEYADFSCPCVVAASKVSPQQVSLRLVCESPDGWHLASQSDVYDVETLSSNVDIIQRIIGLYRPLIGTILSATRGDISLASAMKKSSAKESDDSSFLSPHGSLGALAAGEISPGGLGETLRDFCHLLAQADPERLYSGLRLTTTPEGMRLWLCPFHYAAMQRASISDLISSSTDAFLCHNSKDKRTVRKVAEFLQSKGISFWLDEDRLLPGDPWLTNVSRGMRESNVTIVCIGRAGWSDWMLEELQVALRQSVHNTSRRVIPLLFPNVKKIPDEFPAFLHNRQVIYLASLKDENTLGTLVRAIETSRHETVRRSKGKFTGASLPD